MAFDLYPESTITTVTLGDDGLWPVSGSEIDLRQEFHDLLYGSATEIAKGRPAILRRMRRDESGNLVRCPCVDSKTNEPDQDTPCQYCWGEGYLWDEEWVIIYKQVVSSARAAPRLPQEYKPGVAWIPLEYIYMEYFVNPTRFDKYIEVALDEEGAPVVPYKREAKYNISLPQYLRADNGRIEYWRLAVNRDTLKSNWEQV